MRNRKNFFSIFLTGALVGFADILPAISGGTIAYICGIYNELLCSIKSINFSSLLLLFQCQFKEFFLRVNGKFIFPFLGGVVFSLFFMTKCIYHLLLYETTRIYLFSLFFGAMVAIIYMLFKKIEKWKVSYVFYLLLGLSISLIALSYGKKTDQFTLHIPLKNIQNQILEKAENYNTKTSILKNISKKELLLLDRHKLIDKKTSIFNEKNKKTYIIQDLFPSKKSSLVTFDFFLISGGILAISAMLLPGISGSSVLLILGLYDTVIFAINDVFSISSGDFSMYSISILLNLLIGIFIGLALFSRFILWIMKKNKNILNSLVCGLVLGSLKMLWPFWNYVSRLHPLGNGRLFLYGKNPVLPNIFSFYTWGALGLFALGVFLMLKLGKKEFSPKS